MCGLAHWRVSARIGQLPALARHLLVRLRRGPCVCNTLRMVSRVVTQLYDDCLRPSGLRVTQFSILAAVARLGVCPGKQG